MSDAPETAAQSPHDAGFLMGMPNIASRIFDTPLLVSQGRLDMILTALSPRMGFAPGTPMVLDEKAMRAENAQRQAIVRSTAKAIGMVAETQDEGYVLVGNTAVVPVVGTLVQRGGWMSAASGMLSYEYAQSMTAAAMSDRRVERIMHEYDTPGGEVAGAFDFADYLYSLRGQKPMTAIVNEMAASGGYLLASAADEIVVNRTGRVGSIGVVFAHVDRSRAMEKAGVAVTYIYAGDKKIDGNPNQPLPERVRAELQAEIDETYKLFVETAARNTGLSTDAIRATKAGMFTGRAAVDAGLAKRVNTLANELQISVNRTGARSQRLSAPTKEAQMSKDNPAVDMTHTAAQVEAARAEGKAEGTRAGAEAERTRIKAIVTHENAEGRSELASHLAFDSDMAVEAATAMLGKASKATVNAEGGSPLERAMAKAGSANISNDDGADRAKDVPKDRWGTTVAKFSGK